MATTRTPLTAQTLNKPYKFKLMGIEVERSPLTEAEMGALGYRVEPRNTKTAFSLPWHFNTLMGVELKHPVYITGATGAGKDYWAEAYAFATNRPLVKLSIKPNTEPAEWVGTKELRSDGVGGVDTILEQGPLAKCAGGYEVKRGARTFRVDPVVMISDADRARDLEDFRQALERKGRRYYTHPADGSEITIADGVSFVLTGNTGVDGDGGKGMVASQLDTSIVNRLRASYAPPPTAEFEASVLEGDFPQLASTEIKLAVKCLRALRQALEDNAIAYEVSLRTAGMAVESACFMRERMGKKWEEALREGFLGVVQGWCAEADNRALIAGALDPIVGSPSISAGGAI